jgi:hypothetical protein
VAPSPSPTNSTTHARSSDDDEAGGESLGLQLAGNGGAGLFGMATTTCHNCANASHSQDTRALVLCPPHPPTHPPKLDCAPLFPPQHNVSAALMMTQLVMTPRGCSWQATVAPGCLRALLCSWSRPCMALQLASLAQCWRGLGTWLLLLACCVSLVQGQMGSSMGPSQVGARKWGWEVLV